MNRTPMVCAVVLAGCGDIAHENTNTDELETTTQEMRTGEPDLATPPESQAYRDPAVLVADTNDDFVGSGTLITPALVLTADHVVAKVGTKARVFAGQGSRVRSRAFEESRNRFPAVMQSSYPTDMERDYDGHAQDIALIRLTEKSVQANGYASLLVHRPSLDATIQPGDFQVVGYGKGSGIRFDERVRSVASIAWG